MFWYTPLKIHLLNILDKTGEITSLTLTRILGDELGIEYGDEVG